jgi:hypothetical protein
MPRWELAKVVVLSLAISMALTAAGLLAAVGLALLL